VGLVTSLRGTGCSQVVAIVVPRKDTIPTFA
jgi:hypothetical protein